jgi:hypothetical protein
MLFNYLTIHFKYITGENRSYNIRKFMVALIKIGMGVEK